MRLGFVTRGVLVAAAALALAGCKQSSQTADAGSNASAPAAAAPAPVAAPANGDWTQVVTITPEGGFRMGNPAAKVHLVEYASLTCPHCAAFTKESVPTLLATYVKPGKVSYELRNYLRDGIDLTAVLLARCAGPAAFFQLSDQIWADQPNWEVKAGKLSAADQARLQALPPSQQRPAIAKAIGLLDLVTQHGIPAAQANACLNDQGTIDSLSKVQDEANNDHIPGTPAFLVNGTLANTATWEGLEPVLKSALAG